MPKQQTDHLIELIRSLTKAEKRSFRLYTTRQNNADDKLFILLFDYIETNKNYQEELLLQKYPQIKKSQLSNIKANLLKHLLSVLRHLYKDSCEEMIILEMLDHARIFQSKGIHKASLDILEKAKKHALKYDVLLPALLAINEERLIESNYITGSTASKANQLKSESESIMKRLKIQNDLANLSVILYSMYLKYGYVRDKKDFEFIKEFFEIHLPKIDPLELNFHSRIYYFQSCVWFYHMAQDFLNYYKFSKKWTDTFESEPEMIRSEKILYLKGMHNTLNALYMANKADKFVYAYQEFTRFGNMNSDTFDINETSVFELFRYIHLLNKIFLTGEYDQGVLEIRELTEVLKSNRFHWDINRLMVFYYKVACVYFGADDFGKSLDYLHKINNSPIQNIREDVQCFARILSLICHFELGNEVLVSYQIKSVYRYLSKMENLQSVQKEILSFIRKTPQLYPKNLKSEFIKLRSKLMKYAEDPYEKRPFLYLDIISWLNSKILSKRIQTIIKEKPTH
ncbi:MAG: hypothetical protein IPM42_09290 [Saprospiraceae bacterium]|nr:hypothetical protein [Saprospiraceae bacterium]